MKVYYVTPTKGRTSLIDVFPFRKDMIEQIVPGNIKCGNYLIGCVSMAEDGCSEFRVSYFGRSDQNSNSLQERISCHLVSNWRNEICVYDDDCYFYAEESKDSLEAYRKECGDFDTFFSAPGVHKVGYGYTSDKMNTHERHGLKLNDSSSFTYVDNSNRPAKP